MMTYEDLASYHGKIEEPLSVPYRGYDVYKAGFWNQGPALLQSLRILEGFDLHAMGQDSADAHPHDGRGYQARLCGPRSLLRRSGLRPGAGRRAAVGALCARAPRADRPAQRQPRATSRRSAQLAIGADAAPRGTLTRRTRRDQKTRQPSDRRHDVACRRGRRDGNLFSATPSSGWLLGGAFVAGRTGVPMSNRMQAFNLDPPSPNVLAGGKRPRTTLTPTIVLKDGKPFLAIGTPGGDSQDQQILLVLLNIIDFGMDVQAAIEAPRVNSLHPVSSFDNHRAQPGVLEAEASLAQTVLTALEGARSRAPRQASLRHLDRRGRGGDRPRQRTAPGRRRSPPRTRHRGLVAVLNGHSVHQTHARNGLDVLVHEDHARADRRGERLVSRRIQERSARPDRLRASLRAPDVRGIAALRPRLLPSAAGGGRRAERLDQRRPHELLGGRARPTRSIWRCGWNPIGWATCCPR